MDYIGIVEDDAAVRELIEATLMSAGFETLSYESGEAFFEAGETAKPRLLLLDIMLPGMDGFEILRRLQNDGCETPVIFLTARNTELDKVAGLNLGADDFISKPFGVLELIARVKAALRRTAKQEKPQRIQAGVLAVDAAARKAYVDGLPVELTYKEFEVLQYLAANKDIVLTRDMLLSRVWGMDAELETRTVDAHVKTLRQKLGKAGAYVKTVRGVGYQFSAE